MIRRDLLSALGDNKARDDRAHHDQSRDDHSRDDKTRDDKSRGDNGRGEKGRADRGRGDKGRGDRGRADRGRGDKGRGDKARDDRNGDERRRANDRQDRHGRPERPDQLPVAPVVPAELHLELTTADHEEPTWEVRPATDRARRRRIDRRTRIILSVAAAAAIVVNAGAAWSYWRITQPAPVGSAAGGTAVELTLRARNDLNRSLTPGGTSNLTVTVTNEDDFPIRITTVKPGSGTIVADDEHRAAGCLHPGVTITRPRFSVSWDVQRNTIGVFTIADGLVMGKHVARACVGAVFTIPVQVSGYRVEPA